MTIYYVGDKIETVGTGGEKYMKEVLDYLDSRTSLTYLQPNIRALFRGRVTYDMNARSIAAGLKSNVAALRRVLRCKPGDVLVTNSYFRHWFLLCNPVARYARRCTVVSFINAIYFYSRGSALLNTIDRLLMFVYLSSSSVVVANSRSTKEELVRLGIGRQKIEVIYPRLDLPKVFQSTGLRARKHGFCLLFVGYCDPCKELDVLIRAVGLCKDLPLSLDIVGDDQGRPEYSEKLRRLARESGIVDRVRFHGRLEGVDLSRMYAVADALVSPGRGEGYGRVLVEAMHTGLPVIGADGGASSELIQNGVNGFLFEPGNSQDLKDKIVTLFKDETVRTGMGARARRRSNLANFSHNVGEQFCDVLQSRGILAHTKGRTL